MLRIVVVDDSPEDIYTIQRLLKPYAQTYALSCFNSVKKVQEDLDWRAVDVMLVDYNLAGMSAAEFISTCKLTCASLPPLIILTGQGNEQIAVEMLKNGASDYLIKSELNSEVLVKSIQYVTEKNRLVNRELEYQHLLRSLIDNIPVPFFYKDKNGNYLGCNKAFEELTGVSRDELDSKRPDQLFPQESIDFIAIKDRELLDNPGSQKYETVLTDTSGNKRFVININNTYTDIKGELAGIVGTINDITEFREKERQLYEKTYMDVLTLVPNRRFFDENVQNSWNFCRRLKVPMSIMMVDIDHFKQINDQYGHQSGDVCLTYVAQIIKQKLKRSTDFVARFGGDEFVVVLSITDLQGAQQVADQILQSVRSAEIDLFYTVTVSIGVASNQSFSDSIVDLIARADQALYQAKQAGRNGATSIPESGG